MFGDRTYIEINLDNIHHNFSVICKKFGPHVQIMSVLKGNAYGHGITLCAPECDPYTDFFAVATIQEAAQIRKSGVKKPVLLLGPVAKSQLSLVLEYDITLHIHTLEYAEMLHRYFNNLGQKVQCHIKIDTGLNRLGFTCRPGKEEACAQQVSRIYQFSSIQVKGIYTHFACADSLQEQDMAFTKLQFSCFQSVCNLLESKGYVVGIRHCCSSAASLLWPENRMDMVRIGMPIFGQSYDNESAEELGLKPILNWKAQVVQIRRVGKGENIGYCRTYTSKMDQTIAVVSVGYGDGYKRNYSNHTRVIINGQYAPVLSTVSMDYIVVDVTEIHNVEVGNFVTLLGCSGNLVITANELAECNNSVCGDVTCSIGRRVPKIYYKNHQTVYRESST